jgi:hypothetical protein
MQSQAIQDQIREQFQRLKEENLEHRKEESEKLLDLKVKLQRHETKKQIFSFNMYKVRKLSDHELFKEDPDQNY